MEDFSLRQYCNEFSIKMACAICNKLVQPAEKMNLFSQADAIALNIRQCMLSQILGEKEEFFLCDLCKSLISKCAEKIDLMELRTHLKPKEDIRCVWCKNSNDLKEIFLGEQSIKYDILVGLLADYVNMPAWICNVCDDLLKDLDELHQSVSNTTGEKSNISRPEKQVRRVVSEPAMASSSKSHSSELDFPRERENEMEPGLISSEADIPCITPHTPLHEEHFLLRLELENESVKTADDDKSCTSGHVMELFDIQPEEILYAPSEWRTGELEEESSGTYKVSSLPDDVDQQPKDEDKQVKCKESKQVHSSTECGSKLLNTILEKGFDKTLTKQENVTELFGCVVEKGNSETFPQLWTDDDAKSTKGIMEEKYSNHTGLTPQDKISKAGMPGFKRSDKFERKKDAPNVDEDDKDVKSLIDKILGDVGKTSALKQLIIGASTGWLTGYLAMKVGKVAACAVGGGILLLEIANEKDYIKINWDKVNKQVDKVSDQVEEKIAGQGPNWMDKMERFVDRKMDKAEELLKNRQNKAKRWYSSVVGNSDVKLKEIHIFLVSFTAGLAIGIATS